MLSPARCVNSKALAVIAMRAGLDASFTQDPWLFHSPFTQPSRQANACRYDRHLPAVRAMQRTAIWKNHPSHDPIISCITTYPESNTPITLYRRRRHRYLISIFACRLYWTSNKAEPFSFFTDSPVATLFGLCSSLFPFENMRICGITQCATSFVCPRKRTASFIWFSSNRNTELWIMQWEISHTITMHSPGHNCTKLKRITIKVLGPGVCFIVLVELHK